MLRACVGVGAGLFASVIEPAAVFAGAWTLPSGTGQVIATSLGSFADRGFGASSPPRYRKLDFQALLQYGVSDRFTAIAMPSLQYVAIGPPVGQQHWEMGYSDFGGRFRFVEGSGWVMSAQAVLRVPGSSGAAVPGGAGGRDVEIDLRALLGVGFSVYGRNAFLDVQVGRRLRADMLPDEFRGDVTLGVQILPRWLVLAQSFSVMSLAAGTPSAADYAYHKLQLSAVYALTSALSLQLGGFTTYAGEQALQENGIVLGAWYRF